MHVAQLEELLEILESVQVEEAEEDKINRAINMIREDLGTTKRFNITYYLRDEIHSATVTKLSRTYPEHREIIKGLTAALRVVGDAGKSGNHD